MSRSDNNNQQPQSEVQQAIKQADASQIKKNLEQDNANQGEQIDAPQKLSEDEATPFIDDKARTDK